MPAYLTRIARPPCARCLNWATQELRDGDNTLVDLYCDQHAQRALDAKLATPTCPRCGGKRGSRASTVITSPEDDLWNDRIGFECEGRILARMARS